MADNCAGVLGRAGSGGNHQEWGSACSLLLRRESDCGRKKRKTGIRLLKDSMSCAQCIRKVLKLGTATHQTYPAKKQHSRTANACSKGTTEHTHTGTHTYAANNTAPQSKSHSRQRHKTAYRHLSAHSTHSTHPLRVSTYTRSTHLSPSDQTQRPTVFSKHSPTLPKKRSHTI